MCAPDWRMLGERPRQTPQAWRYGLLVEDIVTDSLRYESYGVMITDCSTGQVHRRRHITTRALEAASLLDLLARNQVSPITLDDVLEDWLGR